MNRKINIQTGEPDSDLTGKTVVIVGLGLHGGGVAAAKWAAKQKARVIVTDLRTHRQLGNSLQQLRRYHNIRYVFGKHRAADFRTADLIIKNPAVPPTSPYLGMARRAGVLVETDVSMFLWQSHSPVIAITGTKGKSTTTALVHHILRSARMRPLLAGNIRISPFSIIDHTVPSRPAVLELSSWQIEDIGHVPIAPHVAVLTNLMPDHLNRHKTMQRYAAVKARLFRYQDEHDFAILNYDNIYTRKIGRLVPGKRIWFSRKPMTEVNAVFVRKGMIVERLDGRERRLIRIADLPLAGAHNTENVLAACAAVAPYRIPVSVTRRAIRSFTGIPGRLELVRTRKGIQYYNDTTATMPQATVAALTSFQQKVVLIAGGTDKKLDFRSLIKAIPRHCRYVVLLPGNATRNILRGLKRKKFTRYVEVPSMSAAVAIANEHAQPSGIVLLSPGAASFGLFLHEFDRGDKFVKAVRAIS